MVKLETALNEVKGEYKDFQDKKKVEDLLTVKLEIESYSQEMLAKEDVDIEKIEKEKIDLETRVGLLSKDLNLVISTEKSLAEKVKAFRTRCLDLETKLSQIGIVSADEIKQLKRELSLATDKNKNLETGFEELKVEYQ